MKITTLIENLVYNQGLVAEHGLSILIETGTKKILFDTGQSWAFIKNARELGIDISEVDALVISHGHYDHAGGLYPFLEINSTGKVFVKKNFFLPKYRTNKEFIGVEKTDVMLKDRLVFVEEVIEIADDVFIMPDIPINDSADTHFLGMHVEKNGRLEPDEFNDELYLAIKINNKINVITACSHRGITNICTAATNHFNLPAGLILGGFHMKNCTEAQFSNISGYFIELKPESIGACHCTGVDMYSKLKVELGTRVFYNFTGNIVELN